MSLSKSIILGVISFLVVYMGVPATTFAWRGNMTFSNIGTISMPNFTVGSFPMQNMGGYSGYSRPNYSNGYSGRYGGQYYTSTYPARSFDPLHDTFPSYPQQSYGYGGYGYGSYGNGGYGNYGGYGYSQPMNSYPSISYDPYYGYSAAFGPAYPTGDTDFAGTPLCQWYDYSGRSPCAFDPQQWVYDPYTGSWY